jgi:pyruvate kinase
VLSGGPLSDNKSVNLPGIDIDMPYLSDQDRADIQFAVENELDFIALSFVRTGQDVMDVKRLLAHKGESGIELISKIEKPLRHRPHRRDHPAFRGHHGGPRRHGRRDPL